MDPRCLNITVNFQFVDGVDPEFTLVVAYQLPPGVSFAASNISNGIPDHLATNYSLYLSGPSMQLSQLNGTWLYLLHVNPSDGSGGNDNVSGNVRCDILFEDGTHVITPWQTFAIGNNHVSQDTHIYTQYPPPPALPPAPPRHFPPPLPAPPHGIPYVQKPFFGGMCQPLKTGDGDAPRKAE